jgi:hypothetical protein
MSESESISPKSKKMAFVPRLKSIGLKPEGHANDRWPKDYREDGNMINV